MANAPILADLREPPVVGKFYMVPAIERYPYHGRVDTWPVIGPKHTDAEFFEFASEHYHVDARFISASQERFLTRYWKQWARSVVDVVGRSPLASRGHPLPKGRPALVRRKCRAPAYGFSFGSMKPVQALRAHYGDPAQPIRLADGRLLCPHRKADLSQFPADDKGVVTCPLHGLRVQCKDASHD